ncbi:MAG TPA: Ku protein, partial [Tistrella mobilis]|nr:Ku protein [Tistrella mobilis]
MARKPAKRRTDAAEDTEDAANRPSSRPVWTGNMRLALVSVPVKLYAA